MMIPGKVAAHGGLPGGGGFYSGVAHPVLAVEQFLALLAFGLLLGRQTGAYARSPLGVLVLGVAGGLAFGTMGVADEPMLLAMALVCGAGVAVSLPPPIWGTAVLAGLIGWLVGRGTDVPSTIPASLVDASMPYAGVFVGVVLITLNAAALAMVAQGPVPRTAVRVLGSWIAAIALMVVALRISGTGVS